MPLLIDDFWDDVIRLLVEQHRFLPNVAQQQVEGYRSAVKDTGMGEALMHFGPEKFATGIHERQLKAGVVLGSVSYEVAMKLNKCSNCGTAKHLQAKWDSDTQMGWVHCDKCGKLSTSVSLQQGRDAIMQKWNDENTGEGGYGDAT